MLGLGGALSRRAAYRHASPTADVAKGDKLLSPDEVDDIVSGIPSACSGNMIVVPGSPATCKRGRFS